MPRKEFESFTRLDASDVNTFLMDQSVMTFAGTAARGSAITTPVEGMVTYLEDSNSLQLWDGASWTSAGGASSGNAIINGAFEINQRNFSSTTLNDFGFDRFFMGAIDGTSTYSAQTFSAGAGPAGYEATNFARLVSTGQTLSSADTSLRHRIEDVRTFAGQTVTVSLYAKAGTGTPSIALEFFAGFGSGGSSTVTTFIGKTAISTSWERYTFTLTLPTMTGKTIGASSFLGLNIFISAGSNFDARTNNLGIQSASIDFWGVQVEAGPVATPFKRNANSLQGELAACQRYYYRIMPNATNVPISFGSNASTTVHRSHIQFPVEMRIAPTGLEQSGIANQYGVGQALLGFVVCSVVPSFVSATTRLAQTNATVASGLTQFYPGAINTDPTNGATAFLAWSAEL
jgi:hypothetical protein